MKHISEHLHHTVISSLKGVLREGMTEKFVAGLAVLQ
jgi:hypothetical protein